MLIHASDLHMKLCSYNKKRLVILDVSILSKFACIYVLKQAYIHIYFNKIVIFLWTKVAHKLHVKLMMSHNLELI
jgi:hypothetical protein